ncbi:hypothetical protein [Streptomyces sp. NPDC047046]
MRHARSSPQSTPPSPGIRVKDSYAVPDLAPHGFFPLFTASRL